MVESCARNNATQKVLSEMLASRFRLSIGQGLSSATLDRAARKASSRTWTCFAPHADVSLCSVNCKPDCGLQRTRIDSGAPIMSMYSVRCISTPGPSGHDHTSWHRA
eukprot:1826836-Amphidinium_carterae.1